MKLPLPPNVLDATEVFQYITQLCINSMRQWQKSGDITTHERIAKFYMDCEKAEWNVKKIEKLEWPFGDRIVQTSELTQPEKFKRCPTCKCKPCQPWSNKHTSDRLAKGLKGTRGSGLTFSYESHSQGHKVLVYKKWKVHCLFDKRHSKHRPYFLVLWPGGSKELPTLAEASQFIQAEESQEP